MAATTFTVDSIPFVVATSAQQTTGPFYFEVSTGGQTRVQSLLVSAQIVSGDQNISGNLTVGGTTSVAGQLTANAGFTVSAISSLTGRVAMGSSLVVAGITSLDGAVAVRGAASFVTTVDVSSFFLAHVTIGVSSLNPLVATRYLQVIDGAGHNIFVPFVSVLPT